MAEESDRIIDRIEERPVVDRAAVREDVTVEPRPVNRADYATAVSRPFGWTEDRLRWGAIVGGIVATMGTMLLLDMLGLAIGLSLLGPGSSVTDLGTGAGIWGGVVALIAFFVGGWFAGRSAAPAAGTVTAFAGWANGAIVWATTIVFLLVLAAIGAGGAAGFLGASLQDITNAVGTANANAQTALSNATNGAWGTFIALGLTLIVAVLGGAAGHAMQPDVRNYDRV